MRMVHTCLCAFLISISSVSTAPLSAESCDKMDAKRVISLGGAITEIIYALGEDEKLVGVDTTSSFPQATAALPKLGYYRAVSAEGLLSLSPDMIIADADAGPDKVLEQVEQAGVCVTRTSDGGTLGSIVARVQEVAEALGVSSDDLISSLKSSFEEIRTKLENIDEKPRVLFLLSAANGTPVVAGLETEADAIIKLAGGVNASSAIKGYKPLTPEAAIAAAPDYILMMDHVVMQSGGADKIFAIPQIAMTPAGKEKRLVSMDGLLLLGFGPRTPLAIASLAREIYPEMTIVSE